MALFVFAGLAACTPPTDEERVALLNRRVAPEGHFTNTHFIVKWPAIKGKKHVNAKPLTLKIPLEYLPYQAYLKEPKANPILRRNVSMASYMMRDGNIHNVGVHVTYEAQPRQLRATKQYKDKETLNKARKSKQWEELLRRNVGRFNIKVSRDADDGKYARALENKSKAINNGFYVRYFGNTTHQKRKFQVYWDLHGHKVVLYGRLAPAKYHKGEQYTDSNQSIFPIDKTNAYYRHTEIDDWRDIAVPVRDLLESFVVQD